VKLSEVTGFLSVRFAEHCLGNYCMGDSRVIAYHPRTCGIHLTDRLPLAEVQWGRDAGKQCSLRFPWNGSSINVP